MSMRRGPKQDPTPRAASRSGGARIARSATTPRLHAAVAAFVSDESISDNVLTPHSMTWNNENMMVVSLDHAMCSTAPSGWTSGSCCVNVPSSPWVLVASRPAELHTADGSLVATMNQEALLRI